MGSECHGGINTLERSCNGALNPWVTFNEKDFSSMEQHKISDKNNEDKDYGVCVKWWQLSFFFKQHT